MTRRMVLCGLFIAATHAWADDSRRVVGTWKLVSFWNELQDGSEARPM